MDAAGGLGGKLLLYAEVEDGLISADLFYVDDPNHVRFRFAPNSLKELIYRFWREWREAPANKEWRTMTYAVEGGKFTVDFAYPDQVDAAADVLERRPKVVKAPFGGASVDYSRPK